MPAPGECTQRGESNQTQRGDSGEGGACAQRGLGERNEARAAGASVAEARVRLRLRAAPGGGRARGGPAEKGCARGIPLIMKARGGQWVRANASGQGVRGLEGRRAKGRRRGARTLGARRWVGRWEGGREERQKGREPRAGPAAGGGERYPPRAGRAPARRRTLCAACLALSLPPFLRPSVSGRAVFSVLGPRGGAARPGHEAEEG